MVLNREENFGGSDRSTIESCREAGVREASSLADGVAGARGGDRHPKGNCCARSEWGGGGGVYDLPPNIASRGRDATRAETARFSVRFTGPSGLTENPIRNSPMEMIAAPTCGCRSPLSGNYAK